MGARLRTAEEEAAQLHLEREESLRSLKQRAGADSELLVRGLVLAEELPHSGGCEALQNCQSKDMKAWTAAGRLDSELHMCQWLDRATASLWLQPSMIQGFRHLCACQASLKQRVGGATQLLMSHTARGQAEGGSRLGTSAAVQGFKWHQDAQLHLEQEESVLLAS